MHVCANNTAIKAYPRAHMHRDSDLRVGMSAAPGYSGQEEEFDRRQDEQEMIEEKANRKKKKKKNGKGEKANLAADKPSFENPLEE
jgi:hypothetical protein